MPDEMSKPTSRRVFLRRIAMGGAILLIPSAAVALTPAASLPIHHAPASAGAAADSSLRIGMLLPESQLIPQLGQSLLQGFQLALDTHHATSAQQRDLIEIVPVGYGTSPSLALRQASDLIANRRVDLMSGVISRNHASSLAPQLRDQQIPLVVSDIGANVISAASLSPYLIRSSLGYWQSSLALGSWAAQQLGRRAVIAASFYESGYDTIHAFRSGFEQRGGQVLETVISDAPYQGYATPAEAIARIAAQHPDVVYAAYSGQAAVAFMRAYADSPLHQQVPLVGTGMLVDADLLPAMGAAALGVRSAFTWAPSRASAQNQAFSTAFMARTGRPADPFALLGYDSASLIIAASQQSDGAHRRESFLTALQHTSIESPRGTLTIEPTYFESSSPIYLREVRASAGSFSNQIITRLDAASAHDPHVMALRETQRSGWTNAYLCV